MLVQRRGVCLEGGKKAVGPCVLWAFDRGEGREGEEGKADGWGGGGASSSKLKRERLLEHSRGRVHGFAG